MDCEAWLTGEASGTFSYMKQAVQWETLLLLDNRFADGKGGEIMQPFAALATLEALVLKVAWVKHQTSHLDNEFDMQMIETSDSI